MGRPKGKGTKHLTVDERQRVRTLYYDAHLSPARIVEITGYSKFQVRTAIRAPSAAIPHRPGRPKKSDAAREQGQNIQIQDSGENMTEPAIVE